MEVRLVTIDEVSAFILMEKRAEADSGTGHGHFNPYSKDASFDLEETLLKTTKRWSTPITDTGWTRSFCWSVDGIIVGGLTLAGGHMPTELHRVFLGMGLVPAYRGRGGGTALLNRALAWATEQAEIAWVDLGVFGDNPVAERLYRKLGFKEMGRENDRFRIDGVKVDNISMTYFVGHDEGVT
jgi:RimJ/RimL family protein N-acetyltransferase